MMRYHNMTQEDTVAAYQCCCCCCCNWIVLFLLFAIIEKRVAWFAKRIGSKRKEFENKICSLNSSDQRPDPSCASVYLAVCLLQFISGYTWNYEMKKESSHEIPATLFSCFQRGCCLMSSGANGIFIYCLRSVIEKDLQPFQYIRKDENMPIHRHAVVYQIIDHKLYREQQCTFPARCLGVEYFLLKLIHVLPNTEFVVNVCDYPLINKYSSKQAVFSFSKTADDLDIMYPVWSFWKGGPYIPVYKDGISRWDIQREVLIKAAKQWPWSKKSNKAFFRGSRTSKVRDRLILLSRQKPHLIDAQYTTNQATRSLDDTLGKEPADFVTLDYHCRYKYLFNFRGVAASFRFRHLFLCRSLVFHVGDEWKEFFYYKMKPWIHYIPVKEDLNDVEELLEFVKENDDVAKDIAERGYQFILNHLTMDNVTAYWESLLKQFTDRLVYDVQKREGMIEIL
ncbi:Protein O-glucosyltransferase 1 [Trichinella nelsoni]|uniref:Protein O-glucosyltransferase 1 n=2 Tax=Trichinella TaxID=6333 RepID=A0A0V0RM87_9BILA|nr:Protein O-glucosyltransferase 1 [Trichinella nelsoni]